MLVSLFFLTGCGDIDVKVDKYPVFFETPDQYSSMKIAPSVCHQDPYYQNYVDKYLKYELKNYNTYSFTDENADLTLYPRINHFWTDFQEIEHVDVWTETIYLMDDYCYEDFLDGYVYDIEECYIVDDEGNYIVDEYIEHRDYWYTYRNEGELNMEVIIKDGDQSTVFKREYSNKCASEAENPMDVYTDDEIIFCIIDKILPNIARDVSIYRTTLHLNEKDVMQVQGFDKDDGKWEKESTFHPGEQIRVVIGLPETAKFNEFTVDVVVRDTNIPLVSQSFMWQKEDKSLEFLFDTSEIISKAPADAKKFTVRFRSFKEVYIENDIKIKP